MAKNKQNTEVIISDEVAPVVEVQTEAPVVEVQAEAPVVEVQAEAPVVEVQAEAPVSKIVEVMVNNTFVKKVRHSSITRAGFTV